MGQAVGQYAASVPRSLAEQAFWGFGQKSGHLLDQQESAIGADDHEIDVVDHGMGAGQVGPMHAVINRDLFGQCVGQSSKGIEFALYAERYRFVAAD